MAKKFFKETEDEVLEFFAGKRNKETGTEPWTLTRYLKGPDGLPVCGALGVERAELPTKGTSMARVLKAFGLSDERWVTYRLVLNGGAGAPKGDEQLWAAWDSKLQVSHIPTWEEAEQEALFANERAFAEFRERALAAGKTEDWISEVIDAEVLPSFEAEEED